MSELINSALRAALREDRDDLAAFAERADEATLTFEEMLKSLDLDGEVSFDKDQTDIDPKP